MDSAKTVIASYQHNFIFLKTRKVAGSSIELYLRQFCGPDDIVTALMDYEEPLAREFGAREPTPINQRLAFPWEMTPEKFKKMIAWRQWPRTSQWWTHQPAKYVRRQIGIRQWDASTRFTIVRNPWDRVISSYFWANRGAGRGESLDEIIAKSDENWRIYTIDNALAVDHVIRFENLLNDFGNVCEQIGIPRPDKLPFLKSGIRSNEVRPNTFLTAQQVERIAKVCHREIELFGYEYDFK